MAKIKVGILGATGIVGQRLVMLLANHPWFELSEVAASEKSAGKTYEEAVSGRWKVPGELPEFVKSMRVKECKPNLDCSLVFSSLDAAVAGEIEENFAKAGYVVSSNSRNHRMDKDVPLLIPEVNPEHLAAIKNQKFGKGFIITNPNCSTVGLAVALAPLKGFGIKTVNVTTMQALSGAGWPAMEQLPIQDNMIPFIGGEEGKMEIEALKILGDYSKGKFKLANFKVSAQCNRVNVVDGHTECVSVKFRKKPKVSEIIKKFRAFNPLKKYNLPTSPDHPIIYREEDNRPQPKLDRDEGNGMTVSIGRLQECKVNDYKFVLLVHNAVKGAAGAAVQNAELLKAKGYLDY